MDEKEKEKAYGSSKFSLEYPSKLFPDHSCKTRLVQISLYYVAYHIKKNSLSFSLPYKQDAIVLCFTFMFIV